MRRSPIQRDPNEGARPILQVPWSAAAGNFIYPCHGSQYDEAGMVVRGPAPRSLALAHVHVDRDQVVLTPWSTTDFRHGSQGWWT